jgi:tetratricopeptide (TPR) repeat protein
MGFIKKHVLATPWRLIRLFTPFTFVFPLAVYYLTVFRGVYPGDSAYLTATAAGLCKPNDLAHPFFTLASHAVAALPYGTLSLRLNLFCALCGALAVALFYLITARLVFMFACEDAGGALAALPPRIRDRDAGDDTPQAEDDADSAQKNVDSISIPHSVVTHNRRVSHAAVLGGLGAAFILAFCAPFWLVSTRLFPYTFDLMLLFAIINLIISYDQRERLSSLFLGVFLLVACSVESPLFLLLLPIGCLFLFRSLVLNEQVTTPKVLSVLLIGLSGGIVALTVLWKASAECAAIASPALRPIVRVFCITCVTEVTKWIPSFGWSFTFMQLLFPAAIALFVFSCGFKKRTLWPFLMQLALVACLVPSLLNLPISLWGIARLTSKIPIFSYVIVALFVGLMIAIWHLMREMFQEKIEEDLDFYEYRDNPIVCRLGSLLCWPLLALALVVPFRSFTDIDPHDGTFADEVTETIYKELGPRDWIANCHLLRHHLLIRAHQDNRKIHFIWTDADTYDAEQLAGYIQNDVSFEPYRYRLLNAADLSPASFIREWLKNETNAYQRVVLFDTPSIWRENGFSAVPTGFFLSGQPKDTPVDSLALLARHKAFVESIRPKLYPSKPDSIRLFAQYRTRLCAQLATMANEIGVLLAAQNHVEEAADLFAQSETLAPDNLSLLLNRYHLAANLGVHAESLGVLENRLNGIPRQRNTFTLDLTALQAESGTLINPDTLEYVRKTYWTKTSAYRNLVIHTQTFHSDPLLVLRDKKRELHQAITRNIDNNEFNDAERQLNLLLDLDEKDRFALLNKALIAIERHDLPEAGLWLDLAKENGVQPNDLVWHEAAILVLNGKLADARAMLNVALPSDPSNIRLWGLLADILLRQDEYHELENRVYPALRSASNKREHYLLYMVRGYLYKHHGVQEYTAARAAFLRAFALNKNLTDVGEEILRIDDVLDVPSFSEQDAKTALRKNPEHAFANYLLGMARLHRNEIEKADDLFRRSLEKDRNAPAYAGLGAVMLAKGDYAAAEKLVRRSLELDATRPFTWHTLAKILLATERADEASKALDTAQKGLPDSLDVRLTLIRLRMKQKKYDEAASLVSDMLDKEDQYPPAISQQLHGLANQLSAELSK